MKRDSGRLIEVKTRGTILIESLITGRLKKQSKQLKLHSDVVYMKRLFALFERAAIGLRVGLLISVMYLLQDKTCIVWDLSKLTYVRQLSQHVAPITAICINDLTVSQLISVEHSDVTYSSSSATVSWVTQHP